MVASVRRAVVCLPQTIPHPFDETERMGTRGLRQVSKANTGVLRCGQDDVSTEVGRAAAQAGGGQVDEGAGHGYQGGEDQGGETGYLLVAGGVEGEEDEGGGEDAGERWLRGCRRGRLKGRIRLGSRRRRTTRATNSRSRAAP